MREQVPMGMNRTGVQMSPFDSSAMQSAMPVSMTPATPGDDTAIADMRGSYIANSDPLGSVPLPGTVQGAISAGAAMLTGDQPQLLLDKLGERLAFERTGTRLYDALMTKFEAVQERPASMTLADLHKIRQDEARHFAIIADAIETLGGDPTSQTPCADLVGVESSGLMQAVTDPRTTIAQSLHAVLVAEMADNAGWEFLIALTEDQQQNALISEFSVALNEERAHLQQIQKWFEEATFGGVRSAGGPLVDDIADANPSSQLH